MPKELQQNCIEQTIIKAAERLGVRINFDYADDANVNDSQIDISEVLLAANIDSVLLIDGKSAESLQAEIAPYLNDKSAVYIVRTGTNGGPGHYRTLYHDTEKQCWVMYSSPRNHYDMTDRQGKFTSAAGDLVVKHGKWGGAFGEYFIQLARVHSNFLVMARQFIFDTRINGHARALDNLYNNSNIATPLSTHHHEQADPTPSLAGRIHANAPFSITASNKKEFLVNLQNALKDPKISRANLLDFFAEIKNPTGAYQLIHEQKNPTFDRIRLFFKSAKNPNEKNFWHTATYQKAVKLLKEAYLNKVGDESDKDRQNDANAFIDYIRGNAPIHTKHTTTRQLKK